MTFPLPRQMLVVGQFICNCEELAEAVAHDLGAWAARPCIASQVDTKIERRGDLVEVEIHARLPFISPDILDCFKPPKT